MERYSSGSSLERTDKEQSLDSLERMLGGDWSDEFYVGMKMLSHANIRLLHATIALTINDVHDKYKKPTKG